MMNRMQGETALAGVRECTYCAEENPAIGEYCLHCGSRFAATGAPTAGRATPPPPPPSAKPSSTPRPTITREQAKSRLWAAARVASQVAGLVACGAAAWLAWDGRKVRSELAQADWELTLLQDGVQRSTITANVVPCVGETQELVTS